MKTIASIRVACALLTSSLAAFSIACSGPPADAETGGAASTIARDAPTDDAVESASRARYVFIQASPTGYELTTLNEDARSEVKALDLTHTGLDPHALATALSEPETIAAHGAIRNGDTFVATSVYRALPHSRAPWSGAYYVAHTLHGVETASLVNGSSTRRFHRLDLSQAAVPYGDDAWVTARILDGGALVGGSVSAGVFQVTPVFVSIPEAVACPKEMEPECGAGMVATYERDASRCLLPTGCVRRAVCPLLIPTCLPEYVRATWPSARGCPAYVCDPAFDPAP